MKSFKQFNEVAPPGFGHTKSDKEKGVKKGGTAAAFKRALDRGDFKGLPGSKTKKEKTADMFKLMWAMKKKGDKPHYKPGTDEKYKKYQEEDWKPEIEHSKLGDAVKKKAEKKRKEAESSLPPHLRLDAMKKAFAHTNESLGFTIDSGEHKKASKKAKIRNLAKGNTNPNEKAAAEKKAGGPKLYGEDLATKASGDSNFSKGTGSRLKRGFIPGEGSKPVKKIIGEEECKCEGCGQDPCVVCGESHHNVEESISTSDTKRLEKATVLSFSNDPKSVDRARARQVEVDYKDLMKQQKAKKKKSVKEEKKSCPAGEYYCFDRGKCMPIPEGHKVREDGELVKEGVRGAAIGAAVGGVVAGPLGAAAGAALGASSGTGKKRVAAYNKGREVVQSVKDKARKIKQTLKGAQEKRRESVQKTMAKEEKMTPMQDNNLFGNAYAGSEKLKKEKKKAIDAIPDKNTEQYNRNWKHKTPDNPRESVKLLGADGKVAHEIIDIIKPEPMKVPESPMKWKELVEKVKLPAVNGSIINVYLTWRGRGISIKLFFPQSRTRRPTREEVNSQIQKVYPGAKVGSYIESDPEPGEPFLQVGD